MSASDMMSLFPQGQRVYINLMNGAEITVSIEGWRPNGVVVHLKDGIAFIPFVSIVSISRDTEE